MSLTFAQISEHAISLGASDIHISGNTPPMVRVDGVLKEVRVSTLTSSDIRAILSSIMTSEQEEVLHRELELTFVYEAPNHARYRVNAFTSSGELSATIRIIPSKIPSLSDLDSPYAIKSLSNSQGLVIIAGTLGSGKSTTLAAMVEHINQTSTKHIITIESPIEFVHKPAKSLISQRLVGLDTKSYATGIQSALLEDPDVIVVDELGSASVITSAIAAASTGCLVLTTLNATSTMSAITLVTSPFKPEPIPTDSLSAIITQALLPKATGHGRVAAYEVLPIPAAIATLIRENKIDEIQKTLTTMGLEGAISMDDYIQKLILCGSIREDQRSSKPGFTSGTVSSDEGEF